MPASLSPSSKFSSATGASTVDAELFPTTLRVLDQLQNGTSITGQALFLPASDQLQLLVNAISSNKVKKARAGGPKVVFVVAWSHFPEMMATHIASVHNFVEEAVLYVVVNTSTSNATAAAIAEVANEFGVVHVRAPPKSERIHVSSVHLQSMRKATKAVLAEGMLDAHDKLVYFDSDMFFLSPFSFAKVAEGFNYVTWLRKRKATDGEVRCFWLNFLVINLSSFKKPFKVLQELDFDKCSGYRGASDMDSGGCTAKLVDGNPSLKIYSAKVLFCPSVLSNDTSQPRIVYEYEHQKLDETLDVLQPTYSAIPVALFQRQQCIAPTFRPPLDIEDLRYCTKPESLVFPSFAGMGIYHMRGSGSNYRGCPAEHLRYRQLSVLHRVLEGLLYRHGPFEA